MGGVRQLTRKYRILFPRFSVSDLQRAYEETRRLWGPDRTCPSMSSATGHTGTSWRSTSWHPVTGGGAWRAARSTGASSKFLRPTFTSSTPNDLTGLDAIELGCGTAYVSAWLARRGARVVGIDNSPKQLETARRLQAEHGLDFPLLLGNAETVPYPDGAFDFAISEYGAALWADPYEWIPEASRLLRPGGSLVFLTNSVLAYLTVPDVEADGAADERLKRPQFGMYCITWPDDNNELGRVPSRARRLDPAAQCKWVPGRGPSRDPGAQGCHDQLPVDECRVGTPVALRGGLEGSQVPLRG